MSDYRNHSENSLRSNSSSCRFACLAHAIQESKKIPIIVHPINTSSCGMFLGLLSFSLMRGLGQSSIKKGMANPEGAKAGEPYQNFDGEGFPS